MSKFCTSCGSQIPDEATNCPNCGALIASTTASTPVAATPVTPDSATTAAPNPKNKSTMVGIVAIGVAVILVIILLANIFGGNYKKPIKEYIKSSEILANVYYNEDIEGSAKLSVDFKDKDKLDKDDLEDYEDDLDVDIKKAYEVECKIKIKTKDDSDSYKKTFVVGKIDGDWYILKGGLGFGF